MEKNRPIGAKRSALGKGLGSLLGVESGEPLKTSVLSQQVMQLNVKDVEANPGQPRKYFDEEALLELSQSIDTEGVLQPIIVSKSEVEKGKFIIVAGERRWRASKIAGKQHIPAIVREGSDEELMRLALIENIQRADLNIVEEAQAYASLIKDFGLTQDACAKKVGKQRSTVANALRILSLPQQLQEDLIDGTLSMGHGRALLALDDQAKMNELRELIIQNDLNVRQVEKLVQSYKESLKGESSSEGLKDEIKFEKAQDADMLRLTDKLRDKFQTKVRLTGNGSRGKIEISYFNLADLERILETLEI